MRTLAIALAASALIVLPLQAAASTTTNGTADQIKVQPHAAQLNDGGATAAETQSEAESRKKPEDQSAVQTSASVEGKPDKASAHESATERGHSPSES